MHQPDDPQIDPEDAWRAEWPRHCRICGGWGYFEDVDARTGETTMGRCTARPEAACHRCGAPDGIDPDDEVGRGCQHCGWNFDDGIPFDGPKQRP
jgi:hypothetical protein